MLPITNQNISTVIYRATYRAIRFIQESQSSDGAFFDSPSIFATSTILRCIKSLESFDITKSVSENGVRFLLSKKSKNWSWNYWPSQSHCPDDLDDTFSALSAINLYDERLITGEAWAYISRILILCEIDTGGPYKTWIMPPGIKDKNWDDIDVVVNSNIACFLKSKNVQMPMLIKYTEKVIQDSVINGKYDSKYYDDLAILYFISRWYTGGLTKILQRQVLRLRCADGDWGNPLRNALAISTLTAIGTPPEIFLDAVAGLADSMTKFESIPFYIESIDASKPTYACSATLTASLCAEALSLFEQKYLSIATPLTAPIAKSEENHIHDKIISIVKNCIDQFPTNTRHQAHEILNRINSDKQITLLSYYFAKNSAALNDIDTKTIIDISVEIGMANVYGWLAYTIYDNILDNEKSDLSHLLPVANVCFMKALEIYDHVNGGNIRAISKDLIIKMEKANAREKETLPLAGISRENHGESNIPLDTLADKSMPHALGPISLFIIKEKDPSPIIGFFKHYLIAKQLNDDAHDWQDDLKRGFINSVGSMLISEYFSESSKKSLKISELSEIFQRKILDTVSMHISSEASKARAYLENISDDWDISYFNNMLKPLEKSATRAVIERDSILDFISSYESSSDCCRDL